MKAILYNRYYTFEYDCINEDHGFTVCENAYKRMGLIGRYYIKCGDKNTWIN